MTDLYGEEILETIIASELLLRSTIVGGLASCGRGCFSSLATARSLGPSIDRMRKFEKSTLEKKSKS